MQLIFSRPLAQLLLIKHDFCGKKTTLYYIHMPNLDAEIGILATLLLELGAFIVSGHFLKG